MHVLLPVIQQLGLDTLVHPLCPHSPQSPLELQLTGAYVELFELDLELPNDDMSALRVVTDILCVSDQA